MNDGSAAAESARAMTAVGRQFQFAAGETGRREGECAKVGEAPRAACRPRFAREAACFGYAAGHRTVGGRPCD